jgi:hypothetical protein
MTFVNICGEDFSWRGVTDEGCGIITPTQIFWTFPKLIRAGGFGERTERLLPYPPEIIRRITWDPPDLTASFPEDVAEIYARKQEYYRRVTPEQYLRDYSGTGALTVDQFESVRARLLGMTVNEFGATRSARDAIWQKRGTAEVAERHGYRPIEEQLWVYASFKRLGMDDGGANEAVMQVTHVAEYDDPGETIIYLRGIKAQSVHHYEPDETVFSVRGIQVQSAHFTSKESASNQPEPVATNKSLSDQKVAAMECDSFHFDGAVWRVVFDGSKFFLKDTLGAKYIDHLLHQPRSPIPVADLEHQINPEHAALLQPERSDVESTSSDSEQLEIHPGDQLNGADELNHAGESIQPHHDKRTTAEILRDLGRLRAQRAAGPSAVLARELDEEIEQLETALRSARSFPDARDRARDNVRKAIRAVTLKLERGSDPEKAFAEHLKNHVSFGFEVMYTDQRSWR